MSTLTVVLRIFALLAYAGLTLLTVSWCRGQAKTRAPQDRGDRAPVAANFTAFGLFSGDWENPLGSSHFQVRVNDWDPIRAEH